MRPTLVLALTFAIGALAGCHAPADDAPATATVRLMGWFADYDATIAEDFNDTVSPYSDDVLMMESFPPGFQIREIDPQACPQLRAALLEKSYLASVGECESDADVVQDGDDTTSSDA